METFKWSLFYLFSVLQFTTGYASTPNKDPSTEPSLVATSTVRWHHRFRMDQNPANKPNNIGPMELSIFRLVIRKYAKESKLSKDASKKLLKIFESHPPKIGSRDEDRSGWSELQWKQEELEARLHRKRVKTLAFESINEHKELNIFFRKLEMHEESIKREVERQVRDDLHRIAKRNHLDDTEFNKFMEFREANKPSIHWRLNMHPNEQKKAEAAIDHSWKLTKTDALSHVTPGQKPHMDLFLKDVEETSTRRQNRQHQNNRVKQFFGKLSYWRQQTHSPFTADSQLQSPF